MIKKIDIRPGVKVVTRYSLGCGEVQGINWRKEYPIVIKFKNGLDSARLDEIKKIIRN